MTVRSIYHVALDSYLSPVRYNAAHRFTQTLHTTFFGNNAAPQQLQALK